MGVATNAVFEGAAMAGQILSVQMGYSLVNILDPNTQVDSYGCVVLSPKYGHAHFSRAGCSPLDFCARWHTVSRSLPAGFRP